MAEFVIEDTETGLKLAVEGDTTPTQDDAHALIGDELATLRTNLYEAPGGRFVLDVGPLARLRYLLDEPTVREIANVSEAKARQLDPHHRSADYKGLLRRLYDEEYARVTGLPIAERVRSATAKTLATMPENTFMLIVHGKESGGFTTEWEHEFTLQNAAQLLGSRSNVVRNFVNTACYGGKCNPEDYSAAFPNLTNVVATASTNINVMSIENTAEGFPFGAGVGVSKWTRTDDGQWMDAKDESSLHPIMPTLVPMHDVAP